MAKGDLGVIIVAGGSARRFGRNKLLLEIAGMPLFLYSIKALAPFCKPGNLVVVTPTGERAPFRRAAEKFLPDTLIRWTHGGASRSLSVQNGLRALNTMERGFVAIHDAARPLADGELLMKLLDAARKCGGAIPGKPVTDTLKRTNAKGMIIETVAREELWRVETPQVFNLAKLREAYALNPQGDFTDDAGVFCAAGFRCRLVENRSLNIKITYPDDADELERAIVSDKDDMP